MKRAYGIGTEEDTWDTLGTEDIPHNLIHLRGDRATADLGSIIEPSTGITPACSFSSAVSSPFVANEAQDHGGVALDNLRDLVSYSVSMLLADLPNAITQFNAHECSARSIVEAAAVEVANLGITHLLADEFTQALSAFQEAALLCPHDAEFFVLIFRSLGMLTLEDETIALAESLFSRSLICAHTALLPPICWPPLTAALV